MTCLYGEPGGLTQAPIPAVIYLAEGRGASIVAVSTSGDWPAGTALEWHTDPVLSMPAIVDGTTARWDMTASQVAQVYDSRQARVVVDGGLPRIVASVLVDYAWTAGGGQALGQVIVGPQGVSVESATVVSGRLMLTMSSGEVIDAGPVSGAGSVSWLDLTDLPTAFPPTAHNHDDRYYTEAEVTTALAGKEATGVAASLLSAHTGATDPHPQYTTSSEAAAAAPVQSVAGKTGDVTLAVEDVSGAVASTDGRLSDPRTPLAHNNRIVALGDSITLGSESYASGEWHRGSWARLAAGMSGQRFRLVRNAGIAGNTSAQMLARFDTDVTPYTPGVVLVMAGTNDVSTAVSAGGATPDATVIATYRANMAAIVAKCHAIGATPVILTIPPNDTNARHALTAKLNVWLAEWCRTSRLNLIDAHSALVGTANGDYADTAGDGTHPTQAGHVQLAGVVSAALTPLFPASPSPCATYEDPATNLVVGGLMGGTPSGYGLPAPWYYYGGPVAGVTFSTVTDALVPGKMLRIAAAGTAAAGQASKSHTTGFAIGDTVEVSAIVTKVAGCVARFSLYFTDSSPARQWVTVLDTPALTRYTISVRGVVPAGTTALNVIMALDAGTGSADFGRVTLRNLTALGLV